MNPTNNKEQLLSIQYLRAVAALMVVLHHARNPKPWLFNPLEGYENFSKGVDIFFVISGFIMYVAARTEAPVDFLKRRAIRIIPLYWCATLALFIVNHAYNQSFVTAVELLNILKSMLFVPQYSLKFPDKIWPYLIPGWTLNYEMFFYFIFFVSLTLGRVIYGASIIILSLYAVGRLFAFGDPIMIVYTKKLILEFVIGIWIAAAYLNGLLNKKTAGFLIVGFVGLLAPPEKIPHFPSGWGNIVFSSLIIIGVVSLETRAPFNSWLKLLGDASYSIYLMHTVIPLRLGELLFRKIPAEGWVQFIGLMSFDLSMSVVVGVIVHLHFEKPLIKWLRIRLAPAVKCSS